MRSQPEVDLPRLHRLIDRFDALSVLVVGDLMLDEYLWGTAERLSPEAPVPVVCIERESLVLGGAGNVVRNLVALGARAELCGVVGDDDAASALRVLLAAESVSDAGLVVDEARPTPRKTRVVASGQLLVRFDRERQAPLSKSAERSLLERVCERCADCQGAIAEDYAKGTLAPATARKLVAKMKQAGLQVAVDPKCDLAPWKGADLLKPNLREAESLAGVRFAEKDGGRALLARIQRRLPGTDLAITRGGEGMTLCQSGGLPEHVPTSAREVFDVQGAGDTTIAALMLARLAGGSLLESALIANAAAGVAVGKIGTAAVARDELRAGLSAALEAGLEKR